jgi:hypothetical protein
VLARYNIRCIALKKKILKKENIFILVIMNFIKLK